MCPTSTTVLYSQPPSGLLFHPWTDPLNPPQQVLHPELHETVNKNKKKYHQISHTA